MSNAVKLAKAGKILAYIGIFSQSIAGLSMVMPKTVIIFVIAAVIPSIAGVVMGLIAFKKREEVEKSQWGYDSANYNAVIAIAAGTAVWRFVTAISLLAIIIIGITYIPKRMQPWQFNRIPQNKKDVIFKISCQNIMYFVVAVVIANLLSPLLIGIIEIRMK